MEDDFELEPQKTRSPGARDAAVIAVEPVYCATE
jgi:hypothetical protein